jgi:hypothetical protein
MAGEKIKLKEEAISDILVADTNWESVAEDRDAKDYFEKERRKERKRTRRR